MSGKVSKILTWRWVESKETRAELAAMSAEEKKYRAKPQREFFVHFQGMSYWRCEWVSELQMEVFNSTTLRAYWKKFDMEEPPKLDEDEQISRRRKHAKEGRTEVDQMEERFYKNGVRPEWLQVHRILNHQQLRDGSIQYMVKWRELGYDKFSWDEEDPDIPNFKEAIERYYVSY